MSLADYDGLKQEVIDWTHRDDQDLKIDTFIDLAEAEMYANPIEVLKLRDGEAIEAFSTNTTDRFVALPTGYQSMRKVRIQVVNGESLPLIFRTPGQLVLKSAASMPQFFTITDQVEFDRISDQVYAGEFQYYQEFTPLSTGNPTNAVLTKFPDVYLFGAIWAAKLQAEEEIEAEQYYQRFINAIRGANNKHRLGRYGPSPQMHVDGPTP